MRGSHGGSGNGVHGVLAADPGGKDVQAGSKDVIACSVVGEVSPLVSKGRGANGDGLFGRSRRVVARVCVVIAGSDSEVNTSIDSSVDGQVKSSGLATTETHVGSAALPALLSLALLGRLLLLRVTLSSPFNALDDIRHGSGAVGSEDFDGIDLSLFGDTILRSSNSTGAVSSMTIAVDVFIVGRDGLAPVSTTFEVDVINVGASINDVYIDTFTSVFGVQVLVECAEAQAVPVRDTGQTPWSVLLDLWLIILHSVNLRVLLDVVDLNK